MFYIIDGHNLIPKIPGLNLAMADDEIKLVHYLQDYARIKRLSIEVYFDRAAAGFAGTRHFGTVTAHFVRQGRTADQEIIDRLRKMKKAARGVVLVTSDRQIKAEAHYMQVEIISSDNFANALVEALSQADTAEQSANHSAVMGNINEWLDIFGSEDEKE
ncbi:MAG: NYN domain-containing protein [Anaerolineae bacterium]|nr:NYN domain-containing protein [Anaerolineae bacterium]